MTYFITFLEGIFSFLSPCMLPMLPVYLSYFAGKADCRKRKIGRIAAFICGFTITFMALGLFFSALGSVLSGYRTVVHVVCGICMMLFGLSFLDVVKLPMFRGISSRVEVSGILSAFVFGIVYSVNLTPCVGAFLGSALMLAASAGNVVKGAGLLLLYSLGLGIPFLLSALLVSHLDVLFRGIKAHYQLFNRICGSFLIVIGILIASGYMNRWMLLFQ